jgi:N-methylhydantoinase A
MSYRLGVDVGGTFTDVLLVEEGSGATWRAKTASTPSDQAVGVLNGIAKVCTEAGIELSEVAQVLHGTTVATNAILEGKGATVGLVTTKGFRQVLQIARSYVPGGLAGWIIWPDPSHWRRWRTPSRWTSASRPTAPSSASSTRPTSVPSSRSCRASTRSPSL